MYKLVTNDSLVHALIALPFEGRLEIRGVDTPVLCIPFAEEYDTIKKIKEIVNDTVKMAVVHVYDGDQLVAEYKNFYNLEQITTAKYKVGDEEVEVLMAKMSRESTIPEQLTELTNQLKKMGEEKKKLEEALTSFQDKTSKEIETVKTTAENTNNEIQNFINTTGATVKDLVENTGTMKDLADGALTAARDAMGSAGEAVGKVETITQNIQNFTETVNRNFEILGEQEASRTEAIATVEKTVNDLVTEVKGVNEEDMDLDQLKEHRILQSKVNLHEYLENATLRSDAHGGVEDDYSIKEEKQTQLMAMIMMATMNPAYQPSWNAKGKPCSYDWTIDELKLLAAQIEAIVRPLISKQQHMETDIQNATTIDEVKAVDITF